MRTRKSLLLLVLLLTAAASLALAEVGVTSSKVRVGSVLALQGRASGLGQGMLDGMSAAFAGAKLGGRSIEIVARNDSYEPARAKEETEKLVKEGVFAVIGNVGTPTAIVTLPILKSSNVPAVGFFTGAGVLRPGAGGPIINFRASYVQETAEVIDSAIKAGMKPAQVCAFVQNDGYGMSGLAGIKRALQQHKGDAKVISTLDQIIGMSGDNPARNDVGPVGVYVRNNIAVNPGYESLKAWEKKSGQPCKLVVTVGAYGTIAHFARKAKQEGEKWIISAVSFTGADNLREDLQKYSATDRIIMTQVVPLPQSSQPIVAEAKQKLGNKFGIVSLEGYIVGKLFLKIAGDVRGELTRDAFMAQARKTKFDLGGVPINLTDDNQASDLVVLSHLKGDGFVPMTDGAMKSMLK